jgi:hypothetical protein
MAHQDKPAPEEYVRGFTGPDGIVGPDAARTLLAETCRQGFAQLKGGGSGHLTTVPRMLGQRSDL